MSINLSNFPPFLFITVKYICCSDLPAWSPKDVTDQISINFHNFSYLYADICTQWVFQKTTTNQNQSILVISISWLPIPILAAERTTCFTFFREQKFLSLSVPYLTIVISLPFPWVHTLLSWRSLSFHYFPFWDRQLRKLEMRTKSWSRGNMSLIKWHCSLSHSFSIRDATEQQTTAVFLSSLHSQQLLWFPRSLYCYSLEESPACGRWKLFKCKPYYTVARLYIGTLTFIDQYLKLWLPMCLKLFLYMFNRL